MAWTKFKVFAEDKFCYNNFPKQVLVFMCLQYKSFENTVGKGVTSNFSFSHSVFYPFVELSAIFINFRIVVCKIFQFGRV